MAISFDKAFGIHQHTLKVRTERAEVIASNIANANTPGYKARGLNFDQALAQAQYKQSQSMARTHEKHIDAKMELNNAVDFRVPNQPDTGDGNTVDVQVERNKYMENTLEYQASFQFLNGKVKGLRKALTGGQ